MSTERFYSDYLYDYFGVNSLVVWKTVFDDLPLLQEHIERLIVEAEAARNQGV
ncbi:MAG: hypothetical protein JXR84_12755 [Anaerolineae bacterium]|nr:hypothetical protein [Anaerolineae bacterium]